MSEVKFNIKLNIDGKEHSLCKAQLFFAIYDNSPK